MQAATKQQRWKMTTAAAAVHFAIITLVALGSIEFVRIGTTLSVAMAKTINATR